MLIASYIPYILNFSEPGGTSRGVMTTRKVWYLILKDTVYPERIGIGECAPLSGLSCEDPATYEPVLEKVCKDIQSYIANPESLMDFPSIRFGVEMAWIDFQNGGVRNLFPSDFTQGNEALRINGLVWMGSQQEMLRRIGQKLEAGFTCLKMKIGAIDFEKEYSLLRKLRATFPAKELELRVDANGAFEFNEALEKLSRLATLDIHSIEQPIKAGKREEMAALCARRILPIALDEELIGIHTASARREMLDFISPQYIILKPSLIGGFASSSDWIRLAKEKNIGWWVTSALESNIGLNAIAQWTYMQQNELPQGLGTGQVFTNNIPSRLNLAGELLYLNANMPLPADYAFLKQNNAIHNEND